MGRGQSGHIPSKVEVRGNGLPTPLEALAVEDGSARCRVGWAGADSLDMAFTESNELVRSLARANLLWGMKAP